MTLDKTKKNEPEELYRLLSAMAKDLEQLYDCLRSQQRALVKCNLEDFNRTLELENTLVEQNIQRDGQYQELTARMLGGKGGLIPLKELTEKLEPPWPERFDLLAERLRRTGGMVKTMQKNNEFLISRARELVNERLKLMLELAQKNRATYEGSGKKKKQANLNKLLDRRF